MFKFLAALSNQCYNYNITVIEPDSCLPGHVCDVAQLHVTQSKIHVATRDGKAYDLTAPATVTKKKEQSS